MTDWRSPLPTPLNEPTSPNSHTWKTLKKYVYFYLKQTEKEIPEEFVRLLVNQALDELPIRDTSWDNLGLLDGVNNITLPPECKTVKRVVWDGVELDRSSIVDFDCQNRYWRDNTGTPTQWAKDGTNLWLNSKPDTAPIGILTIYGKGTLGHFTGAAGEQNPLDFIAVEHQLAPAYFALGELPFDPNDPVQGSRAQKFYTKWTEAKPKVIHAAKERSDDEWSLN